MSESNPLLEHAARWQADRCKLSWTEKVRRVERVLPDLRAWRDARLRKAQQPGREAPEGESSSLRTDD